MKKQVLLSVMYLNFLSGTAENPINPDGMYNFRLRQLSGAEIYHAIVPGHVLQGFAADKDKTSLREKLIRDLPECAVLGDFEVVPDVTLGGDEAYMAAVAINPSFIATGIERGENNMFCTTFRYVGDPNANRRIEFQFISALPTDDLIQVGNEYMFEDMISSLLEAVKENKKGMLLMYADNQEIMYFDRYEMESQNMRKSFELLKAFIEFKERGMMIDGNFVKDFRSSKCTETRYEAVYPHVDDSIYCIHQYSSLQQSVTFELAPSNPAPLDECKVGECSNLEDLTTQFGQRKVRLERYECHGIMFAMHGLEVPIDAVHELFKVNLDSLPDDPKGLYDEFVREQVAKVNGFKAKHGNPGEG